MTSGNGCWLVLLHPLGAASVLVLVLRPRLATTTILALAALLTANVIADLGLAQLIAAGRVRGDWGLALAFAVVPVIGVVYGAGAAVHGPRNGRVRCSKEVAASTPLSRYGCETCTVPGGS